MDDSTLDRLVTADLKARAARADDLAAAAAPLVAYLRQELGRLHPRDASPPPPGSVFSFVTPDEARLLVGVYDSDPLVTEDDRTRARIGTLRRALNFYADEAAYDGRPTSYADRPYEISYVGPPPIAADRGHTAKLALSEAGFAPGGSTR